MIRVAVIGGGAAGLCVARYLVSQPELFSPVVFEQTGSIGGLWVYNEETGKETNGKPIHSSMYCNLRRVQSFIILLLLYLHLHS